MEATFGVIDFNTDKPISSAHEDKFLRVGFAKQIAGLCAQRTASSSVVGIYGQWGEGKSSLKNLICQELDPEIVQIEFNPWYFKDDEDLLTAFFKLFAERLGRKINTSRNRINNAIADYGESVGVLDIIPKASGIVTLLKVLFKLFKGKKTLTTVAAKERLNEFIIELRLNIVIFIDDIDRLDVREVATVFKLVKLLADFPRTTYLLFFDPDIVARMLAPSYGGQVPESGYRFLEKVIQFPLAIPKAHDQALLSFLQEALEETGRQFVIDLQDEQDTLAEMMADDLMILLNTPRKIVRYINALRFTIPMLKGECNTMDLLIIEVLKASLPPYYDSIRNNKTVFLKDYLDEKQNQYEDNRKEALQLVNRIINSYSSPVQQVVRRLTSRLFPRFAWNDPMVAGAGKPATWIIQKRICSPDYFDRYFTFSLQKQDISDVHFAHYYLKASAIPEETLVNQLKDDYEKYTTKRVAFKLVTNRGEIKGASAEKLIGAVCKTSHLVAERQSFDYGSAFSFLALSVVTMLQSLPYLESYALAGSAVRNSSSLSFAAELVARMVMPASKERPSTVFGGNEAVGLKKIYIDRLRELVDEKGLFDAVPEEVMARQLLWWHDVDESDIRNRLLSALEADSSASLKILRIFTPTIHTGVGNSGSVATIKADFSEDEYFLVDKVIGVQNLYSDLLKNWGNLSYLSSIDAAGIRDELNDKTLIGKFQRMYQTHIARLTSDDGLIDR